MDGDRDRGFEASRGPAERIIGPRPARRKFDGRIFRRDGGRIVDAGMVAGTCHKPDDERSLWTVVVIGVLEPREGPAEKIMVPDRPAENAMVASNHVYPAFSGGFDPLTALGDDVAPDSVLATKADKDGNVLWTRPLCAFPQKNDVSGSGRHQGLRQLSLRVAVERRKMSSPRTQVAIALVFLTAALAPLLRHERTRYARRELCCS